jgi:hypothetical protein
LKSFQSGKRLPFTFASTGAPVALGSSLSREHPGVATYRYDLAATYRHLAYVQQANGKPDDAVASLQQSSA